MIEEIVFINKCNTRAGDGVVGLAGGPADDVSFVWTLNRAPR